MLKSTLQLDSQDFPLVMEPLQEPEPNKSMAEDCVVNDRAFADTDCLMELLHSSESGHLQMASLAKQWQRRQDNAVQLLQQQLDTLNMQRMQAERRQRLIVEGPWSPTRDGDLYPSKQEERVEFSSPMDEDEFSSSGGSSSRGSLVGSVNSLLADENESSLQYWKERAKNLEHLLAESMQREEVLLCRIQENGVQPAMSAPLEELEENLHRFDNFLHFTLRKAPVVIAHQDKELRYRFIYNAFQTMSEEEVLGKTDADIYIGVGIQEATEFKKEVLQRGRPMKREIFFNTNLFGSKTFLVAAEPVFNKSGETLGINYVAMDVTDEALKRESLIALREDIAVQKAMETELHKTIDITEETMRAKQMLATMSHEIRSPLSGVVSIAELLARTKLDAEQRQLVEVMMASGDLVLQLINDILDLSKVESGAMKLEAKKFRPREVVKHVLQMALAFVQNKHLSLKGAVSDDVPLEVVGDVLRIRQVFTNLVSNAVKFTHKGEVAIKVCVVPSPAGGTDSTESRSDISGPSASTTSSRHVSEPPSFSHSWTVGQEPNGLMQVVCQNRANDGAEASEISRSSSTSSSISRLSSVASSTLSTSSSFSTKSTDDGKGEDEAGPPVTSIGNPWDLPPTSSEQIWLHCEVCDTGIGIPEVALPSLFEKYTQVSTTHARKYGGTGLGLAICKQLVGLMGGTLEVKSKEGVGSSFSFTLPLRAVKENINQCSLIDKGWAMMSESQDKLESSSKKRGYFHFTPDVATHVVGALSRSLAQGSEGKAKGVKSLHGKIKQNLTSKISESLEGCLVGQNRNKGENILPKVEEEGGILELNNNDVTGTSDSQSSAVEPSEVIKEHSGKTNSKIKSPPSALASSNLLRKNACFSKFTAAPAQSSVQKLVPPGAPLDTGLLRLPRILLAEDNKVNVMVAESMLKRLGHSLEVVNNGAEAVKALQRSEYDLVLMDVSMPVMDGLEATRIIRKFERTGQWTYGQEQVGSARSTSFSPSCDIVSASEAAPLCKPSSRQRTPIIAMTANALADNVVECYHHGMDSFIAKPVTFQKLEQVLKQFIPWSAHHRVEAC